MTGTAPDTDGIQCRPQVTAVVVTWYPEEAPLAALLTALAGQVARIIIVDNTPAGDETTQRRLVAFGRMIPGLHVQHLGENLGIAKALNIGIALARTSGATHVLLSDQDSLPAPDMVAGLLSVHAELAASGSKVGAVGPTFTDRNTGITFPFQAAVPRKFFYGHVRPDAEHPHMETLTLITSGTLVPVEVFADAGAMREDFFIDHVDIEWCHRVRARGWRLYGTSRATMFHCMGDAFLRVWYFGWRRESAYSPLRLYYRIRNFVALCKMGGIDRRWKIRNGWYWLGFVYSHVVFGPRKARSLAMATRGLLDGVRGRMGQYRAD